MLFPKNTILANFIGSIEQEITSAAALTSDESQRQKIQLKLENTWLNLIEESIKDDKFFINKHQSLLFKSLISAKETLNIMSENKYLIKKFPELGNELNKIEYIILTYSLCVSLYQRLGYTALAGKAGGDILYLIYKNALLNNKKSSSNVTSQLAKCLLITSDVNFSEFKKLLNIDEEYQLILGDFFMSILQAYPNAIFNREISKDSFYTKNTVKLGINSEYLEDIKKNLIINPNTFPMLCKPTDWTETNHGGFLSNDNQAVDIITGINEYGHIVENKEPIFKAVNYLNSIKFGVNTDLLNYILSPEGSYILDNITPEDELQRIITLNVAYVYRNTYFYLNTHADWRGRLYTQSFYLSYQGGDLSTALLNFWEGEAINEDGKIYLYIYGANSHNEKGISKASFEERIKWVKLNYDKIINLDKELILSAENPFVFTAFCLNMRKIHNNPNAIIKTPLFLDATCSGIQHLAALMKDLELGSQTNLIPSKMEEGPGDIYDSLLEPINKAINKFGEENLDYSLLSLVKLTRKEVKRSIMTKVYNVTVYGISQQLQGLFEDSISKEHDSKKMEIIKKIQNDLESELKSNKKKTKFKCSGKDGKSISLEKKEIFKIASLINDQIFINYPSLNYIYNYLVDVTKLSAKLGIPMTWITPSGLKITQNYLKKKNKVISVSIFGKVKKLVLKTKLNELDKAKQAQAIIPNIIHSLDASHLINLIKNASIDKFYPLIPIHDCFGTLPNLMSQLEYNVKKEFIIIYSDSQFLNNFHQRFLQSITDNQYEIINKDGKTFVIFLKEELEIPSIPKLGELDIQNIINSKYMIS